MRRSWKNGENQAQNAKNQTKNTPVQNRLGASDRSQWDYENHHSGATGQGTSGGRIYLVKAELITGREQAFHPMEPPSSPSSVITTPPSYHETAQRPADGEGRKVAPSDLEKHRDEYDFRYPCCLCADGSKRGAYVEAAVYPWQNKMMGTTHWITRCASDRCGYQVKIDVYFQLAPLVAYHYPRRDNEEQ
ncbi:hypothetical protein DFH29DRAFT_876528 [Suillus ampliporus]|nr:hypothetical protein DFH29DRAFT_876528 [Suillus ampliporus]